MKNKKLILFLIILFPSAFWLILELSTVNSKKLPHYGPKSLKGADTVYYQVNDQFSQISQGKLVNFKADTLNYPLYVAGFIKESYKKENYRLAGLSEYVQYKTHKIKEIPFLLITSCTDSSSNSCFSDFEKLSVPGTKIKNVFLNQQAFDSLNFAYFREKPVYIDYSFFVLVDKKRNIRGYYDVRFVSEMKRLIEEYQHLRLKEEKKDLINSNKIESK